ncbi:MAG: HlyD family efflux transporter periplasmic adaptor subunit [Magnetospirillum sp.]|nr:HlyD family efflux transporter periplasmic adaptor subunit [Magnetospirillum sp.]
MNTDPRLQLLSSALLLEQAIQRKTRRVDLAHALVNDTAAVHGQAMAFLYLPGTRGYGVSAASAVTDLDRTGPLPQWLRTTARRLQPPDANSAPRLLTAEDLRLPDEDWAKGLPPYWLWLPLPRPGGGLSGVLALLRHTPWQDGDRLLAEPLAACYGHALWAVRGRLPALPALSRRQKIAAALALASLTLMPVHLDTIAPAEVAPADPIPITAPFDGIVADVPVHSYQAVREGEVLASFDARELTMKRDVAARALDVAEAELASLRNQAFVDAASKAKVAVAEQKVALERENLAYAEDRLARHALTAPEDGIVLYDDRFSLQGRPVSAGQALMTLAKPDRKEVRIDIPAAALIPTETGAEVRLFLDMDPSRAIPARLTRLGYEARPVPGGGLAYRYTASFEGGAAAIQLGARGTAKVNGGRVVLAYYLLRRPWAALRQFVGF